MATESKHMVQSIKQRGNSLYVSLPKSALKRLAWNLHDVLAFEVVGESVVLTKVQLPKFNGLRKGV